MHDENAVRPKENTHLNSCQLSYLHNKVIH